MKSLRKALTLEVQERVGFVNITESVGEAVRESGVREGLHSVPWGPTPTASLSATRLRLALRSG